MQTTHDPYLNTVKRSLDEEKIKIRKKQLNRKKKQVSKGFLSQNIDIDKYIYLPESIKKVMLLTIFIMIPYMLGNLFIFFILARFSFEKFESLQINSFMFTWAIGYEFVASILLATIITSAFSFKTSQ